MPLVKVPVAPPDYSTEPWDPYLWPALIFLFLVALVLAQFLPPE